MRRFFLLLLTALIPALYACEEVDIIMEHQTPLYIQGKPVFQALDIDTAPNDTSYLTNNSWKPIQIFSELPEAFAIQTGEKEEAQILLRDNGILYISPESSVMVLGYAMSNVHVHAGKCTFQAIPEPVKAELRQGREEHRIAALRRLYHKYVEMRGLMYFVKNPFEVNSTLSSNVAQKGASLCIAVDANRELFFSDFSLAALKPPFVRITNAENFQYMAVTGIDIFENATSFNFTAAAKDKAGNWVKFCEDIPTAAFRYNYNRGARLRPEITPDEFQQRFKRRYRERLAEMDPEQRKAHQARLQRENRQMSFNARYNQVFSQRRALNESSVFFRQLLQKVSAVKWWDGKFIVPSSGVVTSSFGQHRQYFGGHSATHRGLDIAAPTGTDVLASNNGLIVYVGNNPAHGDNLVIDHGLGVYTAYLHLADIYVQEQDYVERGDVVAALGNSGLSSGPHLHWEMIVNGRRVNPLEWVNLNF